MPKARPAPTKSTDDFASWVAATVPDDVWVSVTVHRSYRRDGGRRSENFEMDIYLDYKGRHISQRSHDLNSLARWLQQVAIPHLFPPPPKPEPRRLGDHGRQLEHKRPKALTHEPPQELLFG